MTSTIIKLNRVEGRHFPTSVVSDVAKVLTEGDVPDGQERIVFVPELLDQSNLVTMGKAQVAAYTLEGDALGYVQTVGL